MTIIVAVADSPEGAEALKAAVAEARTFGADLVAVNLGLRTLDVSGQPDDVAITVVEREGREDRDPADAVLDAIAEHDGQRLVVGIKRRSPAGKALLGSISQKLLLDAPIPVLGVKVPK
ncbi:hypothetical protein GOHSU_25_00270 [Gordonia hirsuta DSM 44140 = NBRC 16056]|uniref:UspA domain-containing protein n=1 Tax=Gordonia hirsuta DSM 44140 = NBRC 16056 TaxID=1121927 RepID=L7LCI8_9ACTN|nr:universal stress protein [Gordonia hirsuta]GAC57792.1 hypothetical protein GOHSU_25_00270 [Gordonia hirsuta DSM 44140 = NBRC 16056]